MTVFGDLDRQLGLQIKVHQCLGWGKLRGSSWTEWTKMESVSFFQMSQSLQLIQTDSREKYQSTDWLQQILFSPLFLNFHQWKKKQTCWQLTCSLIPGPSIHLSIQNLADAVKERQIQTLYPGQTFGGESIVNNKRYDYTVMSTIDMQVLAVHATDFPDFFGEYRSDHVSVFFFPHWFQCLDFDKYANFYLYSLFLIPNQIFKTK